MTGTLGAAHWDWTRVGPVYLWWSEYSEAAVIGPSEGAWGGDNVYRCDRDEWQGDSEELYAHLASHGIVIYPQTP